MGDCIFWCRVIWIVNKPCVPPRLEAASLLQTWRLFIVILGICGLDTLRTSRVLRDSSEQVAGSSSSLGHYVPIRAGGPEDRPSHQACLLPRRPAQPHASRLLAWWLLQFCCCFIQAFSRTSLWKLSSKHTLECVSMLGGLRGMGRPAHDGACPPPAEGASVLLGPFPPSKSSRSLPWSGTFH